MEVNNMKRTDLIQFLEGVKAGKIQLTSNIWKLESGVFYRLTGNDWTPEPKPVFSESDTLICDAEPLSFPGNIIGVGNPENQRTALTESGMLTDDEIELQIQKAPTVESVANDIVIMINKLKK